MEIARTPDGRRIEVGRKVACPADEAWDLLTDPGRWSEWGPSVTAVRYDHDRLRPESDGEVRLPGGLWVSFHVVECAPYRWTWRVARIPATGHRIDELDQSCRVVFEMPVLAAGYVPVCERALGRIERLLAAE